MKIQGAKKREKPPVVVARIEVFAEGKQYVGLCRDLNVSSFGDSEQEARRSAREALELFLEECRSMGTLDEILSDAGYVRDDRGAWVPREPVLIERVTVKAA